MPRQQQQEQTMIIGIDPNKAPLRRYASDHLKSIKYRELAANLEARGVKIVHVGASAIKVNLRGLLQASGTLKQAQIAMMEILRALGADSVNIEPEDVEYLTGRSVFSLSIARGLEAGVAQLEALLQDIPISEDQDGDDVVPIFSQLERAAEFCVMDRHDNDEVHDRLRQGAERDLVSSGLLDHNPNYRVALDRGGIEAPPPELPKEFQTEARPWRSQFDRSDD
jgi:hypothetical protein